ncbi:MAG: serine/threonine-protein kinase [Pseudomonadota bacterium]
MVKGGEFRCPHCGEIHARDVDVCPETGRPVSDLYRLEGEIVDGKYGVMECIGEGGMGVVYRGMHLAVRRPVAIKFLSPDKWKDREAQERFQNEARIAASIGHRNIIEIIDMGKYLGRFFYIVMEYLDGRDMAAVLDEKGSLPPDEAVRIVVQVLQALSAVHSRGVIHRDLKPENVFLVDEPGGGTYVKILDFGVSRVMGDVRSSRPRLTREGVIMGTPAYLSPEQARGKEDLDQRADLYMAGVLLYEMLAGVLPFESRNLGDLLVSIVTETPPSPLDVEPSIPALLSDIVMKSIEKKPEDRFQTPAEFIRALAPFAGGDFTTRVDKAGQAKGAGPAAHGEAEKAAGLAGERDRADRSFHTAATQPISIEDATGGTAIPAAGKKRYAAYAAIIILLTVIAVGTGAVIHLLESEQGGRTGKAPAGGTGGRAAKPVVDADPLQGPPGTWTVRFRPLPEGAAVFVDGVLHPERPVRVDEGSRTRNVKIEIDGKVVLEQSIFIGSDVEVPFDLDKAETSAGKPGGKGKSGKRATGSDAAAGIKKTGEKKAGDPENGIDQEYPEY